MCFRPSFGPRKRKQLWAAVLQGMAFIFWELVSLTSLLFFIADLLSSFGGAGRSCRSSLAALYLPSLVPELLPRGLGARLVEARRKRAVPTAGSSTAVPPWGPLSLCPGSERRTAHGTDRLFRVRGELLDLLHGGLHPGLHVQLPVRAEELISSEIVRDCRVSLAASPTHEPRAPSDKKLQTPPGSRDATAASP